ncbi:hypothetical protein WA026_022512 [Henosepilachna vigintioctopunctata]|uniref:Gastrula zinc finger protein XlCGF57.1-like n=1 Tax=Henosepilachna vigintioctopunctata TaxID=420089 RepID=A0AAW1UNA1_9CUCU
MTLFENKLSKLCRCCMQNGNHNVFTTMFERQPVVKILEYCISEKICSDDGLPENICQQCYDKIISYYLFILNFKKVQLHLLDIFKDSTGIEKDKTVLKERETLGSGFECNEEYSLIKKSQYNRIANSNIEINSNVCSKVELELEVFNIEHTANSEDLKNKDIQIQFLNNLNNGEREEITCRDLCKNNLSKEHFNNHLDECLTEKPCFSKNSTVEKLKPSFQKYICSECEECFEFMKQLEQHCRNTGHGIPRRFCCKICFKKFLSNTRLNDHMRIHNNDKPFKCSECGMTFTSNSNLKRHKKKHTGEKSYFCEVCSRGFIQKHTLTVHMRLHNGETPYVCELCGKGYRTKPLLHQHMYKHKDTETQIIRYRKYYLKYGKMKVECEICKKIITKSALYNHMKIQHGDGLKKFLCNLCGKTYATKMSLGVHMNIHTKKVSYNCTVCSKSFTHQNYLKTHLMLHSGERPHCCDLCGKTFVQRTHLDRHMKTHTGAKPYACSYCDKTFALNENLKVHTRIHTGETTHHCSICGKGFFNSSSKKKHEISIHKMHQKIHKN